MKVIARCLQGMVAATMFAIAIHLSPPVVGTSIANAELIIPRPPIVPGPGDDQVEYGKIYNLFIMTNEGRNPPGLEQSSQVMIDGADIGKKGLRFIFYTSRPIDQQCYHMALTAWTHGDAIKFTFRKAEALGPGPNTGHGAVHVRTVEMCRLAGNS